MKRNFSNALLFILITTTLNQCKAQQTGEGAALVKKLLVANQVLLTNHAIFKEHTTQLVGASGFLLQYQNKIFAVTAQHLLGDAMGISPEVKPTTLKRYFSNWKMFPRVPVNTQTDTVTLSATFLNYDSLSADKDILMLNVANSTYNCKPLLPRFTLPEKGEKLFLIGCPYSEANCKQNMYELTYDSYDEQTSMLYFSMKSNVELRGFSGAPIVDAMGNVVCILITGGSDGGKRFAGGTFIKAIQEIKQTN